MRTLATTTSRFLTRRSTVPMTSMFTPRIVDNHRSSFSTSANLLYTSQTEPVFRSLNTGIKKRFSLHNTPKITDLSSSRAEENAKRLGIIDECREENKARIGVCGNSRIDTSELVLKLGQVGNELGFARDQQHHDILGLHISNKVEKELLRDQVALLSDAGCRLILIPESDISDEWKGEFEGKTKGMAKILYLNEGESLEDFAKRALGEAAKLPKIDPNLHGASNYNEMKKGNQIDLSNFFRRLSSRHISDGGYPRLSAELGDSNLLLIIGGAGPVASATCADQLARLGVPSVHYSVSSAPSKIRDVLGQGLSCVPRYKNADLMLRSFFPDTNMRTIIPCNTLHFLLGEIFSDPATQVIDIRDAVTNFLDTSYSGKVMLLGTEATVFGPKGLEEMGEGLYDKILTDAGCEIIKPSPAQQDIISKAINVAKSGKMKEAREMIDGVILAIREKHGGEVMVGLLCTDLPIAYSPNQIAAKGAFSSITALVQEAQRVMSDIIRPRVAGGSRISGVDSSKHQQLPDTELSNPQVSQLAEQRKMGKIVVNI